MEQAQLLTSEEKRISVYRAGIPTDPRLVTPATRLDELNLNWREKDLPERERTKHVHRLHPYLGKFIPQLVEIFLRKYFRAGETVYDPFCGSGTTLVEANVLNINSIGCDIAAFNPLLSKVKTAEYDVALMKKEAYQRGIASVFAHSGEYMESGKRMIIVIRDKDSLCEDIATQCGFNFEDTIQRHVNRRTGRRARDFRE